VEPCGGAQTKGQQGATKKAGRCDLPFERIGEDSPSVGAYIFPGMFQKPWPKGVSAGGVTVSGAIRPRELPSEA